MISDVFDMHPFLGDDAIIRLCGCDVVDTDCQDLGDGTNDLYPSEGVVVHVVEVGEELEPLQVGGAIVSGFLWCQGWRNLR